MFSRNRLIILAYHRILSDRDPMFPEQTTAKDFDKQLKVLSRYFRVFTLNDAISMLDQRQLPARSVAITFDDGYEDNATVALPLLERYGLKATFFVTTNFVDGGLMWNDQIIESIRNCRQEKVDLSSVGLGQFSLVNHEHRRNAVDSLLDKVKHMPDPDRSQCVQGIVDATATVLPTRLMMSEIQLRLMVQAGMEVGAHTVTHPILTKQTDHDANSEIIESRKFLTQLLGVPVNSFAYPNGRPGSDYNEAHVKFVKEAGFVAAVSTQNGCVCTTSDRYQLPRYGVWDKNQVKFGVRLCQWLVAN